MSLDVAVSSELSLVFPTPILLRNLFTDSFNERLARSILSHRRHGEGGRVTGGGWQSSSELLNWPQLEVRLLFSEVVDAIRHICAGPGKAPDRSPDTSGTILPATATVADAGTRLSGDQMPCRGKAWANINGDGHYNPVRVHPGAQWCAIYHVATGRPAPDRHLNGGLEIMDPRPGAPFGNPDKFAFGQPLEIEPRSGLVVIFPAWLQYCVHPFFGMGHRISITMSITLEED